MKFIVTLYHREELLHNMKYQSLYIMKVQNYLYGTTIVNALDKLNRSLIYMSGEHFNLSNSATMHGEKVEPFFIC